MKEIVLCGAGRNGAELYFRLRHLERELGCARVAAVIDRDGGKTALGDMEITRPEGIAGLDPEALYIVTPACEEIRSYYRDLLQGRRYVLYDEDFDMAQVLEADRTAVNRELCAFNHIEGMDAYFEEAEGEDLLSIFWGEGSVFKRLFQELDLGSVVELACGRGRHVPQYRNAAGHVTLVDILQKNIDLCRKRFGEDGQISYYKNQGYDLRRLKDGEYTAVFSYDAMVHFELLDIYSYLADFYRVLKPGGRALLHHSNCDAMYDASSFSNTFHGRAFMNHKIFAYLATQAGFAVLDQQLLRWQRLPDLDCVSLLEKPADGKRGGAEYGKMLKF